MRASLKKNIGVMRDRYPPRPPPSFTTMELKK